MTFWHRLHENIRKRPLGAHSCQHEASCDSHADGKKDIQDQVSRKHDDRSSILSKNVETSRHGHRLMTDMAQVLTFVFDYCFQDAEEFGLMHPAGSISLGCQIPSVSSLQHLQSAKTQDATTCMLKPRGA